MSSLNYNFFWKNYLSGMKWAKSCAMGNNTGYDLNRDFVSSYDKNLNAMIKASKMAHQVAFDLVYNEDRRNTEEEEEEEQGDEYTSAYDDENEEVEFEINNDFVEFYKESLKYKLEKKNEEKERLRRIAEGEAVDYAVGEQVKSIAKITSIKPPTEIAAKKREEELNEIYGTHAKIIQLAETALQMEFDRNLDTYSPVYWPSLPLKL